MFMRARQVQRRKTNPQGIIIIKMSIKSDSDLQIQNAQSQPEYMTTQIITYMGNKRKLIPIIESVLSEIQEELKTPSLKIGDGFSGSGVVSRLFKTKASELYTNDIAGYSKTLNECYLANPTSKTIAIINKYIDEANRLGDEAAKLRTDQMNNAWVSKHWSPHGSEIKDTDRVYFTDINGRRIDAMRDYIETLPKKYKSFVLAPLLVECSIHNNTNGQFSAYNKHEFGGKTKTDIKRITQEIRIPYPIFDKSKCKTYISQMDSNEWAAQSPELDVVYYDPPYNKHPYNIYYFMLDIINDWDKTIDIPDTYRGQPKTRTKSLYNSISHAKKTLTDLIENTHSKYIILSYNDGGIVPISELDALLEKSHILVKKIPIDHKIYNRLKGIGNYKRTEEYKPVKEYLYVIKTRRLS